MTSATMEAAQARAARIAGAMYLITLATAIFGEFFVRASLIQSYRTLNRDAVLWTTMKSPLVFPIHRSLVFDENL